MSHLADLRPLRTGLRALAYRGHHRPRRFRRLACAAVGVALYTAVHLG